MNFLDMKKWPWQRLTFSLLGITILFIEWRWATYHLYTLPATSISAFAGITTNCMYAVTVLVIWFVCNQLIFNWQNNTTTSIIQQAQQYFEDKKSTTVEIKPKYLDDPSIP